MLVITKANPFLMKRYRMNKYDNITINKYDNITSFQINGVNRFFFKKN